MRISDWSSDVCSSDLSGRGYRFLADQVIALDKLNPQTAARLLPPLGRWRRVDAPRAQSMRAELERIVATPGLSKDVLEPATRSLDDCRAEQMDSPRGLEPR